jgi:uncharacterized protein (DUF488 family)
MTIFTIGFTKTTAESFFSRLSRSGVTKVIDVRLNNVSQLAGFAKKKDLQYFLKTICGIAYEHMPQLAPTRDILDNYRKNSGDWAEYEKQFRKLLEHRRIEESLLRDSFDKACLLCSENQPSHCHRRLVAEYLKEKWGDVELIHL